MFVRVVRTEDGFHFTVVDILKEGEGKEMDLILDLGIIQHAYLDRIQAWYAIADNLIGCDLTEHVKRNIARDLANWLPPLSREDLRQTRQDDLDQLMALSPDESDHTPYIPVDLSERDPLVIIANWLEDN